MRCLASPRLPHIRPERPHRRPTPATDWSANRPRSRLPIADAQRQGTSPVYRSRRRSRRQIRPIRSLLTPYLGSVRKRTAATLRQPLPWHLRVPRPCRLALQRSRQPTIHLRQLPLLQAMFHRMAAILSLFQPRQRSRKLILIRALQHQLVGLGLPVRLRHSVWAPSTRVFGATRSRGVPRLNGPRQPARRMASSAGTRCHPRRQPAR